MPTPTSTLRPTPVGWFYPLGVAVVSAWGFMADSTAGILLAAALTLPSSLVALPVYYVVYGLLAQIPGANPSSVTGSTSCRPDGACEGSTTGVVDGFGLAADGVGILCLTAAAVLNAVLLRRLTPRAQAE